jgi:hypothetical protein
MVILIEIPSHFRNNKWNAKKTYIWKTNIFNVNWHDIFEYIGSKFEIPFERIKINNSCKLYKYNNIENYPLFQSIINQFRYVNSKNNMFTDTLLISMMI